jgi:hypothetical protein
LPSAGAEALGKDCYFADVTLPSAKDLALGKDCFFAECHGLGTRQRLLLCRVSDAWRSANIISLPSAEDLTLGKDSSDFAECKHSAK